MSPIFKNTIIFSFLGHITFFGIFSVSFGNKIPRLDYTPVSFWGQLLGNSQVAPPNTGNLPAYAKKIISRSPDTAALDKINKKGSVPVEYHLKPPLPVGFGGDKAVFKESMEYRYPFKRMDQPIMFHPLLPLNFPLYFKDRQVAHVELMFNKVSLEGKNYITVKRKISSGNLEVDLLAMRYIKHYLFIQQARFTPNKWQVVKIDLSTKND